MASPVFAVERIALDTPGASEDLRDRLRDNSLLIQARGEEVNDPQELYAAAIADYGRLLGALYGAGHYSGIIRIRIDGREATDISPLMLPTAIREIEITVQPGPLFHFSRAEAAPIAPGTDLPDGFRPGGEAQSNVVRDTAAAAVTGWREAGHARAEVQDSRLVANHAAATLDAGLVFAPGPLVQFGDLVVRGNERVRDQRVRQIAGLPTGEVFDPDTIERAAARLRRTGTFASVALTEEEALSPGNTLDITATLIEAPQRRIGFGAEYDTQEGVRLSAFWLHRNLLGGAEQLRLDGEVGRIGARNGGRDYRFSARFTRPATFTPETAFTTGARVETVNLRDYDAIIGSVDAGVTHFFSDTLTGEAAIAYLYERTEDAAGRTSRSALSLPAALTWDGRDDELNTTSGFYLASGVTPFLGLENTDSGAQITFDARGYLSFGAEDRVVLAGRMQGGTVFGADIHRTPRDYLFYSGGGGTVRGQPFRSLGVEVDGAASGGRSFAGLSGEVRTRVTDTIGIVGFADAGHISAGGFGSSGDWHAGAGIGVRYQTGIGPIRADVALPVASDTGRGAQLYIGIGQAF